MGLLYLETYFISSHAFLSKLWAEAVVSIEIIVHLSYLAFVSIISDFNEHIYDVEAPKEKRQKAKYKWLSYQKKVSSASINE